MIIDIHTHIFPPEVRSRREAYFSGEAAFELLYAPPKSKLVGASEIVAAMDAEGVDRSVVFGFPWKNMDTSRRQNDYILAAAERFPDRLIGFACLDPLHPEAGQEAERCLAAGLGGIGELAFYENGIDARARESLAPLMDAARRHDVPVLIHTNEPVGHLYPGKSPNTLMQIYDLIKAYPANKIILAHWGGGIFLYALLKKEVKESLAHVYFDTAASPFLYDARIWRYAADLAGLEKILWGTDFPLLKPGRYFRELAQTGLSEAQIAQICGGNAARLLKISENRGG